MGMFDDEIDPEGGLTLTPDPALDQSVSIPPPMPTVPVRPPVPMPTPPQAPGPPGNAQNILRMALLGLAAGMGPRGGGAGSLSGLGRGEAANEQARQVEYHNKVQQYQQQQQEALRQQQMLEVQRRADEARMAKRAQLLTDVRDAVPKLKTKEDYDRFMDQTGNLLVQSGYRDLSSIMLRGQFKFTPPGSERTIQEALDGFFKSDAAKEVIKERGIESVLGASITPRGLQKMTVADALKTTGTELKLDGDTSVPLEKLTEFQASVVAAKQEFYNDTGRRPSPADNAHIYKRARTMMQNKEQAAKGTAPTSGGLTEDGIDYAATQYRITGVMPPLGMSSKEARASVINRAAAQAKSLGQSPANAIQRQAAYKADGTALTKMRSMSSAAESYETKALAQADIVDGLSSKVNRTQYPIINEGLLSGRARIAGDADTQLLFNALATFTTEYAKIMEGSTGSAAASSDFARAAANRLISPGLNKGTLSKTIELMKREMRLTIDGYNATIDHITNRMGGMPEQPATAQPAANPGRFTIVEKGKG